MTERRTRRFYKDVSVNERDGGFAVLLDGKPLKTPSRAAHALPTRALAEAVAEEWRAQGAELDPAAMPLTRLVSTALERVSVNRAPVVEQTLAFGNSDLVCYRAENSPELAARQAEAWDPLLGWLAERHGAKLAAGAGIAFIEQSAEAKLALEKAVWHLDDIALTGLSASASILGSLVLALALLDGRLDAAEAFRLATLDEAYQSEHWGSDTEAEARLKRLASALADIERFLKLVQSRFTSPQGQG